MAINTSTNKVRIISTTVSGLTTNSKFSDIKSPALVVNTSEGGVFYADGSGGTSLKQLAALPSHSHSYLPLSGGTINGTLKIDNQYWASQLQLHRPNNGDNWGPSIIFTADNSKLGAITMKDDQLYVGDADGAGRTKVSLEGHTHSGYATTTQLGNYLPLAGGTISGDLDINSQTDTTIRYFRMWYYGEGRKNRGMIRVNENNVALSYYSPTDGVNHPLTIGRDGFKYNTYDILHSNNFSTYALPLSGGTLTGTGNVLTLTNSQKGDIGLKFDRNGNTAWEIVNTGGNLKFNELVSNTTRFILNEASQAATNAAIFAGNVKATSFTGNLIGNADTATVLKTTRKIWGQNFNGEADISGDLSILYGDTDKFVMWDYDGDGGAGASWRIGAKGTGSSNTNYFTIQSGTSTTTATTWTDVLNIGQNDFTVYFTNTPCVGSTKVSLEGHTHSYLSSQTWRPIKINNSQKLANSSSTALDISAGSNVTLTWDSTNNRVTIAATDTKYTHPASTSGTTAVDTSAITAATPAHGGKFTIVTGALRDASGHISKVTTQQITLPSDSNTDTKVTTSASSSKLFIIGKTDASKATASAANYNASVYIDASGYLYSGGTKVLTSYTDTKNTTGADNTTSKIFLVGPTAQTSSNGTARTYSNSSCYASGGYLYSGGTKVSVEGHAHTDYITTANSPFKNHGKITSSTTITDLTTGIGYTQGYDPTAVGAYNYGELFTLKGTKQLTQIYFADGGRPYIAATWDSTKLSSRTWKQIAFVSDITDTKNTAGSSNKKTKIFVVGAGSQSSTGVTTYSDVSVYITDGKLYASNFITSSDERIKTNIKEVKNSVDSLGLRFVEFDYKDSSNHSAGHIAQEVKEVLPEFVHEDTTNEEHMLSIDYTGLHSVQIKALLDRIIKLEEEIKILKSSK